MNRCAPSTYCIGLVTALMRGALAPLRHSLTGLLFQISRGGTVQERSAYGAPFGNVLEAY